MIIPYFRWLTVLKLNLVNLNSKQRDEKEMGRKANKHTNANSWGETNNNFRN